MPEFAPRRNRGARGRLAGAAATPLSEPGLLRLPVRRPRLRPCATQEGRATSLATHKHVPAGGVSPAVGP
jgi:hypothetical protein